MDGETWNVVLAPQPRTQSAGLRAGMIPVGETVTAYGHRHENPRTPELERGERRRLGWMGATSLASWFAAIAAGRLIGYW